MKRTRRIRAMIAGTAQRPRASVYRSRTRLSIQLIDDTRGHTLLAGRSDAATGATIAAALELGKAIGVQAVQQGVTSVVFDRSGFRYHGRIKAAAEGLRAGGLTL